MDTTRRMIQRITPLVAALSVLSGLSLVAGPLAGSFESEVLVDLQTDLFVSIDSVLQVNYSFGGLVGTSESEMDLAGGFIWQGFGLSGRLGGFDVQTDLLIGPSTADLIYDQVIVSTSVAGMDLGFYFARLSSAVLGGPAAGGAIRLGVSLGRVKVTSTSEFGARTKDAEFDGITIVHTATGLSQSYVTNPIVPGLGEFDCRGGGLTGEKLVVSGWSLYTMGDIAATLYVDRAGFEFLDVHAEGVPTGIPWLVVDLHLCFELQTKSLILSPRLNLGKTSWIDLYGAIRPGPTSASVGGLECCGLGVTCSWGSIMVKGRSILARDRYVITTPEHGSAIEEIADAAKNGHDYYPDYTGLLSLEVSGIGCRGGDVSLLATTYFQESSSRLIGWGMTHLEASVSTGAFVLRGSMEASPTGLGHAGIGVTVKW